MKITMKRLRNMHRNLSTTTDVDEDGNKTRVRKASYMPFRLWLRTVLGREKDWELVGKIKRLARS